MLGVKVQLELVEVPRAEVEARLAEETLHDGVDHTVLNDSIWQHCKSEKLISNEDSRREVMLLVVYINEIYLKFHTKFSSEMR